MEVAEVFYHSNLGSKVLNHISVTAMKNIQNFNNILTAVITVCSYSGSNIGFVGTYGVCGACGSGRSMDTAMNVLRSSLFGTNPKSAVCCQRMSGNP